MRTFTGSRSASVDAAFSDHADDCTDNGFPRPQGYVMNLTAQAAKEPPITDFLQYVNFSGMAEGLVGGDRVQGRQPRKARGRGSDAALAVLTADSGRWWDLDRKSLEKNRTGIHVISEDPGSP